MSDDPEVGFGCAACRRVPTRADARRVSCRVAPVLTAPNASPPPVQYQKFLVQEGSYVTIEIEDVPEEAVRARDPNMPLLLWNLLEHENKMSVVHFTIKMQAEWQEPIKCVAVTAARRGRGRPFPPLDASTHAHALTPILAISPRAQVQGAAGVLHGHSHLFRPAHLLAAPLGLQAKV